jgi:lipoprotein-releasing system permease protein
LNFEFFISKRISKALFNENNVSARIIKIAITAIALGIVIILISISTGLGLQKEIKNKLTILSGDLKISYYDNNNSFISLKPINLLQINKEKWFDQKKIQHIYSYVNKAVLFKTKENFDGGILKGIDSTFPSHKFQSYLSHGRFLDFRKPESLEIIISSKTSEKLNLKEGDFVNSFFYDFSKSKFPKKRTFQVVGIYKTGFVDFDESFSLTNIKILQKINEWNNNEVGGIELVLKNQFKDSNYKKVIYNSLPSNIDLLAVDELYNGIFNWVSMFDFNILIILIVVVFVAILNITIAIIILIVEKSKLIGMLKIFGASFRKIQKIFFIVTLNIIVKGLIIGNSFGLMMIYLQHQFKLIKLDPNNYFVDRVPVEFSLLNIIFVNFIIIVFSILVSWIPMLIISRMEIVKVLKIK